MFYQVADFFSKLQEGTTPQEQGSIPITLKNFASHFSLCSSFFEKQVAYFAENAACKKMKVRLAAMDNFINPTLCTPFMTSDVLSVNLGLAEGVKETVKAAKDLPDRVLEKAFKEPNLPLKSVRRKPTRTNLIKVSQKQTAGNFVGYQQKSFYQQQRQHYKGA